MTTTKELVWLMGVSYEVDKDQLQQSENNNENNNSSNSVAAFYESANYYYYYSTPGTFPSISATMMQQIFFFKNFKI